MGVILASTKGCLQDYVAESTSGSSWPGGWHAKADPLSPVLHQFVRRAELRPVRAVCVSNACASSHGAFFLAKEWLLSNRCDRVVVAAVDQISEFVEKGFRTLQAICRDRPRPFSQDRDGLALGEGAAVIVLSREPSDFQLENVSIVTEGVSVTRPSERGEGLSRAIGQVKKEPIDFVIAHGTGTQANDRTEDGVMAKLLPGVPLTASKWCVGHMLGASGAIDVIAAVEALRNNTLFRIATTEKADPAFSAPIRPRATSFPLVSFNAP